MKDYIIERKVARAWAIDTFMNDWKKRVQSLMLRKDGVVKIKIYFKDETFVIYKFCNNFFESNIKQLTKGN
jgi:hypothetical protein